MKTEQIELASAIARERSISKAAEALLISQPTASNMLKSLEQELGCQLFDRTRAGALPTDSGMQFLEYAEAIGRSLRGISQIKHPAVRIDLMILSGGREFAVKAFEVLCNKYLTDNNAVDLGHRVMGSVQEAVKMVYDGNGDVAVGMCRKDLYESEVRNATDHHLGITSLGEYVPEITCAEGHPIIRNDTVHYDLLENYPCFSHFPLTTPEPYMSYDVVRRFSGINNRIVMGGCDTQYRLLKSTNGYLVSAPLHPDTKRRYGFASLPIEGVSIAAYAVYTKEPQKAEIINDYIQACMSVGVQYDA